MPAGTESTWDLRADLAFVHLYCSENQLRQLAERVWDRSPAQLNLHEKIFLLMTALPSSIDTFC